MYTNKYLPKQQYDFWDYNGMHVSSWVVPLIFNSKGEKQKPVFNL